MLFRKWQAYWLLFSTPMDLCISNGNGMAKCNCSQDKVLVFLTFHFDDRVPRFSQGH